MRADHVLDLLAGHRPLDHLEREHLDTIARFVRSTPRFADRTTPGGHLTASCWIVDAAFEQALLLHHRKLDRWLQPGGHIEDDPSLPAAALREAREETGLTRLQIQGEGVFDVDVHPIPARGQEAGHDHLDIRFLFVADGGEPLVVSSESKSLRWLPIVDIPALCPDASIVRMCRKTERLRLATARRS